MKVQWNIVGLILFAKAVVFLLIFLAYSFFPFAKQFYTYNFVYPLHSPITLQTAYATWDAQHYLYVSEKGYSPDDDSNAFSPLFPFLMHVVSMVTKNSFWSGILVSNITSLVGLYLFYALIKKLYKEDIAYKSLIFLLLFPTSFFFCLIYTESIFFLLIMIFFWGIITKNLLLTSLAAFFLPFARVIGIAILLPFLTSYIFEYQGFTLYTQVTDILKSILKKQFIFLFSPIIGFCLLLILMQMTTGSFFAQFQAQQNFISHYSFFSIFNPLFFFRALFTFPLAIHGFTNSLLDRLFLGGLLLLIYPALKRVTPSFFVYMLVFGLLPVLSGSFMSYMRYLLVVFPIFIVLAKMVKEKKYAFLEFPIFYTFAILQTLFIIMHSLNYWVA